MRVSWKLISNIVVWGFRIGGVIWAGWNLLQYYFGGSSNLLELKGDDIFVHGVPMIKIFVSFFMIAISGLLDSIFKLFPIKKLNST